VGIFNGKFRQNSFISIGACISTCVRIKVLTPQEKLTILSQIFYFYQNIFVLYEENSLFIKKHIETQDLNS